MSVFLFNKILKAGNVLTEPKKKLSKGKLIPKKEF